MNPRGRPVTGLTVLDLTLHPVWRYVDTDDREVMVAPVKRLPVKSLDGKIVGTEITLANSEKRWATLSNVDVKNARSTKHFLTLSVLVDLKWIHIARCHDHDYAERGPEFLAKALGLRVDDVYPIQYDIRECATGECESLKTCILKEPSEKLSRAEIIALAVS